MIHNGKVGNGYGQKYSQDPGIYRKAGLVCEILHPASNEPESQGQGKRHGNKYNDHEFQGEAPDQGSPGCTHYLSDPNLLGPQLCIVSCNAKKTQAGDSSESEHSSPIETEQSTFSKKEESLCVDNDIYTP